MDWNLLSQKAYYLVPILTAFLYRWGGNGFKPARRYILPVILALYTSRVLEMAVFSLITHFNIKEIEERRWDDIACYGIAQTACFITIGGRLAWILALWWTLGVFWSNIGIPFKFGKEPFRIDWKWIEIVQGFLIGAVCIL